MKKSCVCGVCIGCRVPIITDNPVEQRFWGKARVEHGTAFCFFIKGSDFRKALHALKYHGGKEIGYVFGKYAACDIAESENFRNFDYIVPVPLHPTKFQMRGYNQSACIADGLAAILHAPVETTNLYRAVANPTQTKKSIVERWENAQGIFAVHDAQLFVQKRLLLVDDVLTTGATLIACIEAIHSVTPTARISVFTLAVAV